MILQPLEAATALTLAGFAVVPTLPRSKEIRVAGWPDLRLALDELPQHFNGAEQNVSINWKNSNGRCALDLDAIEAEELAPLLLAPDTPAFGRAGRLRQIVYECPDATNMSLKHGGEMLVEILASGSASLAPGSTQPNGDRVEWCTGRDSDSYVPKKITQAILQLTANVVAGAALLLRYWRSIAGRGIRHDTALQLAGAMLHGGWSDAAVRGVLRGVLQVAGDPELQDRMAGVEGTIKRHKSGQPVTGLPKLADSLPPELTAALVKFWGLGDAAPEINSPAPGVSAGVPVPVQDEVLLTWACDVVEEQVDWHWYGVLAAGKTTLMGGDPGVGKSTIGASLAGLYTTGAPFPGATKRREPMRVLIAAAEDGAGDTKRPRLVAAGADLSKVAFMDLVQTGARQRYFTLADMPALDALLARCAGEFGLLVIDPIGAYLAGRDSHRDADMRELLRPLGDLAERHRIAVLLIAHLNKGTMQSAMDRITGAKAFVAAARLAWLVVKDKDKNTVLVLQLKTNLTEALDGFSYRVIKERLPSGAEASKIVWNDLPFKVTADEALQRQPKEGSGQEQAEVWLQQRLAEGPVAVRVLKEESDLLPYSWDTIKRAAKELRISGEGEKKARVWMLPGHAAGVVVPVDFGSPRKTPTDLEDAPA